MSSPSGDVLESLLDLLRALIERTPPPDPVVRRARMIRRLTEQRERLKAKLQQRDDPMIRARLAGIDAELNALGSISQAEQGKPSSEGPGT